MYKRILLANDGSEYAKRAANNAIGLAKLHSDSYIEILCVHDQHRNSNPLAVRKQQILEIEEMVKNEKIKYKLLFYQGDPGRVIIKHANEYEFDLVVIGSRGLNPFQEFVLGSVSHKVAKQVNCPVLIVK